MLMLPELIVLPPVAVNAPVLVMVTLPPSTSSLSTVTPLVTCGDPVSTVAVSVGPGADGVQFAELLNSLSALPDHADCA